MSDAPWFQPRRVLRRFVADLVADDLARQRRQPLQRPLPWTEDLRLVDDLGVDSLELMNLATALAEALHLHESGIEDYLLARRTLGDWVDIAATGLDRFSGRITFRTSGSTGVPKPCVHTLATLRQETEHLVSLFPATRRILCAVPSHHIYGFLFTLLLPHGLGVPTENVLNLRGSTPAWLARNAQPGDLVIGHPDWWAAVARTVPAFPPGVMGVTSTAPCPDSTSEALEAAGLLRLVQVYGASETAGIGARGSHREAYALFPYWRFDAPDGSALIRSMPEGGDRSFVLQDSVDVMGDTQTFHVGARRDVAVQVGGINVFPSRVREVLTRHPGVADAAVRLMRPDEGARLKAFVVPKDDTPDLLPNLQSWIVKELAPAEQPKAIRVGSALPLGAAGKPADWSVGE